MSNGVVNYDFTKLTNQKLDILKDFVSRRFESLFSKLRFSGLPVQAFHLIRKYNTGNPIPGNFYFEWVAFHFTGNWANDTQSCLGVISGR